MQKFLRVAACTFTMIGCASRQQGAITETELLTYDAELTIVDFSAAQFKFGWEFQNPTSTTATVGAARWTLEIDGETSITQSTPINIEVAAGDLHFVHCDKRHVAGDVLPAQLNVRRGTIDPRLKRCGVEPEVWVIRHVRAAVKRERAGEVGERIFHRRR